jgi:glycosyltransferase involved in cell wall biosynthesis
MTPRVTGSSLLCVSVVIPSLNQARFLRDALDSVLSQDYPSLEVIVMDGGSTDRSLEILKRYADRIHFVSEPDLGQSHAINKGMALAHGQIVSWLNSDDRLVPGAIGKAVAALSANPDAAMLYGEGELIGESGEVVARFGATQAFDLWTLIHVWDYILQPTVFMRVERLREMGGLDESLHYGLDWDLWIRLGSRWPVVYLPEVLAQSREYGQTKTARGGWSRFRELHSILARHGAGGWSPGVLIYWLETLKRQFPSLLGPSTHAEAQAQKRSLLPLLMKPLHRLVTLLIYRRARGAKGMWSDGWMGSAAHHAFAWSGEAGCVRVTVEVPGQPSHFPFSLEVRALEQVRRFSCRQRGFFDVEIPVAAEASPSGRLEVAFRAWPFRRRPGDRRRLSCRLHGLRFEPAPQGGGRPF